MNTKLLYASMLAPLLIGCTVKSEEAPATKHQPSAKITMVSPLTDVQVELRNQMENGLSPAIVVEGEIAPTYSISERMTNFDTPAVSIAYAKGGKVIWAKGYGEGIDNDTIFQAASLSKPVAATGMVSFALNNDIDLDADVGSLLPEVVINSINPEGIPISLRGLLSHTAGATVQGFEGYAIGDDVPTNLQVILGSKTTNSDAVVIVANPENKYQYSGGGFQIAQAIVEEQSQQTFEAIMTAHIFEPIGMKASSFSLKVPGSPGAGIALATDGSGNSIDGGWNVYPEQAAAALWTTPTDYLKFMMALMTANDDSTSNGLSVRIAAEVLTPVSQNYGLGIGIRNSEGRLQYSHSGSNRGYRSFVKAFPDTNEAFIVMTNSRGGVPLSREIMRAASKTYNWSSQKPSSIKRHKLSEVELGKFVGTYGFPRNMNPYLKLTVGVGGLTATVFDRGTFSLVPISDTRFVDTDDGQKIQFKVIDGKMVLDAEGTLLTRLDDN